MMTTQHPDSLHASPVALVTGGAQRIGAAIVRRLHAAGYAVVLHYNRSQQAAAALASELNTQRRNSVYPLQANLLDPLQVKPLATQALAWHGQLDLLVNNASQFYPVALDQVSLDDWQRLMGSNALAPLLLCQALAPALQQQRGVIINLVDSTAESGVQGFTPYTMAKAALSNLTRSLARELAPQVRVNAVAPGAIVWPEYQGGVSDADKAERIRNTALGRVGSVEDIAAAVLFMARASYITGQVLRVDGGAALYH